MNYIMNKLFMLNFDQASMSLDCLIIDIHYRITFLI